MSLYPLKIVKIDEKGLFEDVRYPAISHNNIQMLVSDLVQAKVVSK